MGQALSFNANPFLKKICRNIARDPEHLAPASFPNHREDLTQLPHGESIDYDGEALESLVRSVAEGKMNKEGIVTFLLEAIA